MICGPAGAEAELDELDVLAPVSDLLEQPAKPATTMATMATPATIPRFTNALLLMSLVLLSVASWRHLHRRTVHRLIANPRT
jgi:hypothetical protein